MQFFHALYELLRHLSDDSKWRALIEIVGLRNLYVVLFAIVFCETGLVVMPFLPGDSLIFALGAVAGRKIGIDLAIAAPLLVVAALVGDNVNYWLGRRLGPAIFHTDAETAATRRHWSDRLMSRKHLAEAQSFYEKYGSKTIILARFVPIIRTFAPFVAGIGKMNYARFLLFSVVGAIAWVGICLSAGYSLGSRPFFQKHFELVLIAVIVVSLIPVAVGVVQASSSRRSETS